MKKHPLPKYGQPVLVWIEHEARPRTAEYVSNIWLVDGLESPGSVVAWAPIPTAAKAGWWTRLRTSMSRIRKWRTDDLLLLVAGLLLGTAVLMHLIKLYWICTGQW